MRIVVAEDQYLLRDGIVRLLEAFGHEVVATASTGPETPRALMMHRPDVAVIDVRMPPSNTDEGLRAALRRGKRYQGFPCSCCRSTSSSSTPANSWPMRRAVSAIC